MKRSLTNKLWSDFTQIVSEENLSSYENYYKSLAYWIKIHNRIIGDELIQRFGLETILDIDPKDYLIENPSISLEMEKDRMFKNKPDTLDSLIMGIGNTLWDLITVSDDKNCPICTHGELRYFLAERSSDKIKKIILECASCVWTENLDGSEWNEGIAKLYPVNKKFLLENGVFASKNSINNTTKGLVTSPSPL